MGTVEPEPKGERTHRTAMKQLPFVGGILTAGVFFLTTYLVFLPEKTYSKGKLSKEYAK